MHSTPASLKGPKLSSPALTQAKEIVSTRGWLGLCPEAFRQAVLSRVVLQQFDPGAIIYTVSGPPGGMYGLVSGSIRISMAPGEAGPLTVDVMTPGTWKGYAPLITGSNRIVGLTAGRDCKVLFLSMQAFHEIAAADAATAWRCLAGLALLDAQIALGAIDDLMIRDDAKRFAAVLLRAGGCRYPNELFDSVWLDVSQSDLATMSNLSRTTVNALVRKMVAAGQIEVRYGQIRILAPQDLRKIIQSDV